MKRNIVVFFTVIGILLSITLFSESSNTPYLKVSAIKLKETQAPEKYYYGTVNSLGTIGVMSLL